MPRDVLLLLLLHALNGVSNEQSCSDHHIFYGQNCLLGKGGGVTPLCCNREQWDRTD